MYLHFIIDSRNLTYNEFMGIYSSYIINKGDIDILYIHHLIDIIKDENFNTLRLLKNVKFIDLEHNKSIIEQKLNILYKFGGIILENYILCYTKFITYLNVDKDLIFFRDYTKDLDITNNLSSCIIIGKKQSKYLKQYLDFYKKSKKFILSEELHKFDEIQLIQEDIVLTNEDIDLTNKDDILLFFYKKSNYNIVVNYKIYKIIMKKIKNSMIVRTPKKDSIYYAITDLLINSNRMPNNIDLEQSNNNIDILSINISKVYTKAKDKLKNIIIKNITDNLESDYDIDKIISLIKSIYNIPLKIIRLEECDSKIKITELKNIVINVVDNYYVTIK